MSEPKPPEGYRLLTDEEKTRPLPMDAIYYSHGGKCWNDSGHRGDKGVHFPEGLNIYATRISKAMSERKTPRTDRFAICFRSFSDWSKFARTLETELADLRAKLDAARVAFNSLKWFDDEIVREMRKNGDADTLSPMGRIISDALAQIDTAISPPDTQSKNT